MSQFKPEGYSSISPYLVVSDATRTIHFLESVFDGVLKRSYPTPGGDRLLHAEVRVDDTVIMLADSNAEWPAVAGHVHVYVPDVDAAYARALDAGGTPVQEPEQKSDEDRRGGVRDPGGTTWWIATRVGPPEG